MENFIKLIEQYLMSKDTVKLKANLQFIQRAINLILSQIRTSESLAEAELEFALLEDIQFVLSKAAFKEKVSLTTQLNKFISDFDRIDDKEMKEYLYLKIKSNKYVL